MALYFLTAHDHCERCGSLTGMRALSLLTRESLCLRCFAREARVHKLLRTHGARPLAAAGRAVRRPPANTPKRAKITDADVRAALWRLRTQHALLRIAPADLSPGRSPRLTV